jgi:hypothetical protein
MAGTEAGSRKSPRLTIFLRPERLTIFLHPEMVKPLRAEKVPMMTSLLSSISFRFMFYETLEKDSAVLSSTPQFVKDSVANLGKFCGWNQFGRETPG